MKIAAKALKATDKMMLGKNSLKVATDSIGLIKAGKPICSMILQA
ncbi:hypothetical protein [Acetivibrio clariflavus]|nr:hypothetical protein [Acetivibrio clariflavus]